MSVIILLLGGAPHSVNALRILHSAYDDEDDTVYCVWCPPFNSPINILRCSVSAVIHSTHTWHTRGEPGPRRRVSRDGVRRGVRYSVLGMYDSRYVYGSRRTVVGVR
jgi:hypothetical protein